MFSPRPPLCLMAKVIPGRADMNFGIWAATEEQTNVNHNTLYYGVVTSIIAIPVQFDRSPIKFDATRRDSFKELIFLPYL